MRRKEMTSLTWYWYRIIRKKNLKALQIIHQGILSKRQHQHHPVRELWSTLKDPQLCKSKRASSRQETHHPYNQTTDLGMACELQCSVKDRRRTLWIKAGRRQEEIWIKTWTTWCQRGNLGHQRHLFLIQQSHFRLRSPCLREFMASVMIRKFWE